jgi:HAD superfamily hydrolase (TIGR01509 family)
MPRSVDYAASIPSTAVRGMARPPGRLRRPHRAKPGRAATLPAGARLRRGSAHERGRLEDGGTGRLSTGTKYAAVEAVVLDMEGSLPETEGAYRAAFLAAVAAFGQEVDDAYYATLVGVSSRDRGAPVAARYGPRFPWAARLRDYRFRMAALLAAGVRAKPGAADLLAECEERGLPCAVATSASRRTARAALGRAELLGALAALAARDDVAHGKPHPALFLRAAAALDAPPVRCVAAEDSPPGVAAAAAAGMRVVMVPDAWPPTPAMRRAGFAVAADLHAVRALLRRLRDREEDAA